MMRTIRLSIGNRLALGFGTVLALMGGILGLAFYSLKAAESAQSQTIAIEKRVVLSNEWAALVKSNLDRVEALAAMGNNPGATGFYEPLIEDTSKHIQEKQKEVQSQLTSERGLALMAAIGAPQAAYREARSEFFRRNQQFDPTAMDVVSEKVLPAAKLYLTAMNALLEYQQSRVIDIEAKTKAEMLTIQRVMGVLGLLAFLVGGLLTWLISRSISRPIGESVEAAMQVAKGNLTYVIRAGGNDEVGTLLSSLGTMRQSLVSTVSEVRQVTDSINSASQEIAASNLDLSVRTEQTASNLQSTASSMEQLTGTVRNSADAARQANQLATSATEVAVRGGQVVGQVVSTMEEINQSSKKINDIISVIDGIAFQTNILALNAAVEAARAGEQGRGFAVVAAEVRSLAQRSADAAREIKVLIGASVSKVDAGTRLVADAGETMNEIVGSVKRVSDMIAEITAASGEQSNGLALVSNAVNQLDQMTQQNAALVEESAAAAKGLKDLASRLDQVVQVFQLSESQVRIQPNALAPVATKALPPVAPQVTPRAKLVVSSPPRVADTKAVARPLVSSATKSVKASEAQSGVKPVASARPAAAVASTADNDDWESF